MAKNNDILKELNGVAPGLASEPVEVPYEVPQDYFLLFPGKMLKTALKLNAAATVPDGYFDHFAMNMVDRIRNMEVREELTEIAPFLNRFSKKMPFYLPGGYFDQEIGIPVETKPTRVFALFANNWQRWAVAASVIFMLGFGWLLWDRSNGSDIQGPAISGGEITSLLQTMDEVKLDTLVEEYNVETEFTNLLLIANQDVENSLKTVSTDELSYYMESYNIPEKGI